MNANDNDAALRKNEDENGKWGTSDPLYTVSTTLNVEQVYLSLKNKLSHRGFGFSWNGRNLAVV